MCPIELSDGGSWNKRLQDSQAIREINKRIYFLCEGENTEYFYFLKIKQFRKDIGIKDHIDVNVFKKTGNDNGCTQPKILYTKAEEILAKYIEENKFYVENDFVVIIFDLDCFNNNIELIEFIETYKNKNIRFGMSYPSFELYLFTHDKEKLTNIITNHKDEICENIKNGKRTPIVIKFVDEFKFNPKSKKNIDKFDFFAKNVKSAIANSSLVENDPKKMVGCLSSNIGCIIKDFI